jgi:signal transduction histidine kinase
MILNLSNLDLLSLGLTTAGIAVLGFIILFNNPRSITNRSFFLFSVISIFWGIANYINYHFTSEFWVLWSLRLVIFLATWHAYSLLQFVYVFPTQVTKFPNKFKFILLPLVTFTSILTLTPLAFSRVSNLGLGRFSTVQKGPAMLLFIILTLFNIITAFYILVKKYRNSINTERGQLSTIIDGLLFTFFLLIIFNFLLPALFDINKYSPLGSLFIFPFIAFTAYSISKYKLFNIKVAGTALITFILAVVTFIEIIFSNTIAIILFRSGVFILVLVYGILLLKGVLREVEQREKIEKLADELKTANEGQINLMHIMNHQIKGRLGNTKNIFAELMTEDYGKMPDEAKPLLEKGLIEAETGVSYVQGILKGMSAESGTLPYSMKPMNLSDLVLKAASDQKEHATTKNLAYNFENIEKDLTIDGDYVQLGEAIKNLIDNSITYTPQGNIIIKLARDENNALLSIKDTGAGISEDDKKNLFKPGGRGKDSIKLNVNSTGYGLAFVKGVVDAHHGKVWVESEVGKGSEFFIKLPLIS